MEELEELEDGFKTISPRIVLGTQIRQSIKLLHEMNLKVNEFCRISELNEKNLKKLFCNEQKLKISVL